MIIITITITITNNNNNANNTNTNTNNNNTSDQARQLHLQSAVLVGLPRAKGWIVGKEFRVSSNWT